MKLQGQKIILGLLMLGATLIEYYFLPTLPAMAQTLSINKYVIQSCLPVLLLGTTVSYLFSGNLADIYGPKLIVKWLLIIYLVGVLLCAFSVSALMTLAGMFLQGAGASYIIVFMYITKMYGESALAFISGLVLISMLFVPFSSALAGYITQAYSWRYVYGGMSIFYILLFFMTHALVPVPRDIKTKFSLQKYLRNWCGFMRNKQFMMYTIVCATICSAPYLFYTLSPYIFMVDFQMSSARYGVYLLFPFVGQALGLLLTSLVTKYPRDKLIRIGASIFTMAILLFVLVFYVYPTPLVCIFFISIAMVGFPLVQKNSRYQASQLFPTLSGSAIGVFSVIYASTCVVTIHSAAQTDGEVMGILMLLFAGCGWVVSLFLRPSNEN